MNQKKIVQKFAPKEERMGPKVRAKVEVITPSIAKEMLQMNENNRPIKAKHVEALALEMSIGRWKLNGGTICLNGERLIDGQHRLLAVVKSGVSIETLVARGVPEDAFDTIDVCIPRGHADTLAVKGEVNVRTLAAALVIFDRYKQGLDIENNQKYTNRDIEDLLEWNPGIRRSVRCGRNGAGGKMPPSVLCACHYLFSQIDEWAADEFVRLLTDGCGLSKNNPIYLLRERLIKDKNSRSRSKLNRRYVMALTIKAWNHWFAGKTLRCLKFQDYGDTPEPFPVVEGLE